MKRTTAAPLLIAVLLALGITLDARAQDGLSPTLAPQEPERESTAPPAATERSPFETFPPPTPPPEAPSNVHFELLARGGYMTTPVRGGITPFGLGAGGGLGLAIGHVIIGVSVVGYAGSSDDAGSSEHAVLYGAEAGYDLRIGRLTLRPFAGAGGAAITHSIPTTTTPLPGAALRTQTASTPVQIPDVITQATSIGGGGGGSVSPTRDVIVSTYYIEPGLMAVYNGDSGAFVGLRASVVYFPSVAYAYDTSASWMTLATHLTVGIRF